jgi:hypothetical protein
MRLFKYLPKKYLKAFFRTGALKLGTLYEYRKVEEYGAVIGDKDEGLHKTELFLPGGGQIDLATASPEAEFFRKHVLRPDQRNSKVKIILAEGAKLIAHSNSPDLYIYCMTSEFNADVMSQFGCDSCLEILRPRDFFRAISKRVSNSIRFDGYGPVHYGSKSTHYRLPHSLHPAITKEEHFSYQKECRAIWIPKDGTPTPLFLDVPDARKHCRIHVP